MSELGSVRFSHHAIRMQRVGGVSRYVLELVGAMRALGVDVEVSAYFHANVLARAMGKGVYVGATGPRRLRQGFTLAADAALEWAGPARRRAAVYHYSYYPRWYYGGRGIVAFTVYDMIHERFPLDFDGADHTADAKRKLCHRADLLFAISQATKDELVERLAVDPERVVVTPLGVPTSMTPAMITRTANPRPSILYVGDRIRRYKNFEVLLRAMRTVALQIPDIELVCVGGGPLTSEERRLAPQAGDRAVLRATAADDQELAGLYEDAVALVVPSLAEGFSLPTLEAMQRGCPVVCSRSAALLEVTAGAAATFDPGSAEDLAHQIVRLAFDDDERSARIEAGLARSRDFSWQRCAQATLGGYRMVMEE